MKEKEALKAGRNAIIEKLLSDKGLDGEELSEEDAEVAADLTNQCKNILGKTLVQHNAKKRC